MVLRVFFSDIDGTAAGHGGSWVHDGDGNFSWGTVYALERCQERGVKFVPMSGRHGTSLFETTRAFGLSRFIGELGSVIQLEPGQVHWLTGAWHPTNTDTIHEQIVGSGALDVLFNAFPGQLEFHDDRKTGGPDWNKGREVTVLLRGNIDPVKADDLLADAGHELVVLDNGAIRSGVHAYHLAPPGVSKAAAIRRFLELSGVAREDAAGAGDSEEDLAVAPEVGHFFIMRNGVAKDPQLAQSVAFAGSNVTVTRRSYGEGVYEAVSSLVP